MEATSVNTQRDRNFLKRLMKANSMRNEKTEHPYNSKYLKKKNLSQLLHFQRHNVKSK